MYSYIVQPTTLCGECIDYTLPTTYAYDSGSNGNMFAVKALRDVVITSLDINTMYRGNGAVKVYSRPGGYAGHISIDGWQLVYDNSSTELNGRGRATPLARGFTSVSVRSGEYHSFYVYSEEKLVYKRGYIEGLIYVNDRSLAIYQGIGMRGHFGSVVYSPRVWSGTILYKA